jgi:ribosomal protein L7/L12
MTDFTELKNSLSALSVAETGALVPMLEEAWGVKVPRGGAVSNIAPAPTVTAPAEKTEFSVELTAVGDSTKKIQVIQAVRKITGLDLKLAKALVDTVPQMVLPDPVEKAKAEEIQAELQAAGGVVTLK